MPVNTESEEIGREPATLRNARHAWSEVLVVGTATRLLRGSRGRCAVIRRNLLTVRLEKSTGPYYTVPPWLKQSEPASWRITEMCICCLFTVFNLYYECRRVGIA